MHSVDSSVSTNHRSSFCTWNYANLVAQIFVNSSLLRQPLFANHLCCILFPCLLSTDRFYNHHHYQYDPSISLLFESIFISGGRRRNTYFPLFSSLASDLSKNTWVSGRWYFRSLFICFLYIFSWIRSGGGNWMGTENCFSVTAWFRWQFITPAWKETLFLTTWFGLWFHFVVLSKGISANFMKHWVYFDCFLYPWHMNTSCIVVWTALLPTLYTHLYKALKEWGNLRPQCIKLVDLSPVVQPVSMMMKYIIFVLCQ